MVSPFLSPLGGSRSQFNQPQNQYDFSGWGDRLNKIEQGIASLTDQFKNFQTPGNVAPEYTGNATPEPLEQTANAPEPLGGIESLVAEPAPAPAPMAPTPATPMGGQQGRPYIDPSTAVENTRWHPSFGTTHPNAPMGGQSLTRRGPLSLTEKLRNEYLMGSAVGDLAGIGAPVTMGGEWDARAKEMGFDFRKQVRQLEGGEWAGTGQGPDQFNQLFEEAGGVLDRPTHGAAARYGEGFTNWLGDKGYEVYTEPQQEWMTQGIQQRLGGGQQDMSWYTPHLSQYAMTAEEMKDPTGTLEARRNNRYQPSGDVDVGGIPGLDRGLERLRGGELNQDITNWSDFQQQGNPPLQSALQSGVGSLQGPTQQKIKQGLGPLGAGI